MITSYDVVARDLETARAHRLGPADPGRGTGREEPRDQTPPRASADPAAPCAGAHRDAHRELARRALGDHGPRQPRAARLATGVRAHVRAPDRGRPRRARARAAAGLVGPFLLRRAKDAPEVELELPPITIAKQPCLLTVEQASLYRATVDRWMPRIEEHERQFDRRGAVLAMLGQLKQVCNHPELVLPSGRPLEGPLREARAARRAPPRRAGRRPFPRLHPVPRLRPSRAAPRRAARRRGRLLPRRAHGARTGRPRRAVRVWNRPEILVVSLRAGGRGLNLPAANHVFHFDRWWNPAVEQQATDRVHRFGQRKHVYVTSLVCTATVEERIDQLLDTKRELAEQVIVGPCRRLARGARSRHAPLRRRARARGDRGGGMTARLLEDGAPLSVGGLEERIGAGPWARWLASAAVPDESTLARSAGAARAYRRRERRGDRRRLDHGAGDRLDRERATPCRSPPSRSRRRRGTQQSARSAVVHRSRQPAAGEAQSVQLAHLLETRFGARFAPSARELRRSCTCPDDEPLGACKHVAALAFVVADAIDRDPTLFLLLARLPARRAGAHGSLAGGRRSPSPGRCARSRTAPCSGASAAAASGSAASTSRTRSSGHTTRSPRRGRAGHDPAMEQRLSLVTLGVRDLTRARGFYEAMGWRTGAAPTTTSCSSRPGAWSSRSGARRARRGQRRDRRRRLGRCDARLQRRVTGRGRRGDRGGRARRGRRSGASRAKTFWGGYSGVFVDPDGHPWEIAHNPRWTLARTGRPRSRASRAR